MLRKVLLLAWAVGCFAIPDAHAQDTLLWRTVGQWQVRVDQSLGYGCFLIGSYARGTVLRIGIDQQTGNGYVMVGNEAWRSLQVGNQYDLALRFDNGSPWRGRATARKLSDMVFLYLSFDRVRFLVELARRMNLTIFYNGDFVTQLPLGGTNAAVQEMIRCQRAADALRKNQGPRNNDPFAGGSQGGAPGGSSPGPGYGGPPPAPGINAGPGPGSNPTTPSGGPASAPDGGGGPTFRPNGGQ